jgi:hypothetical protein
MSTAAQINANRHNAQSSTGPKSPETKQKSALNATRHGFTGQTILLTSPEEKAAYETHCIATLEQYQPKTHQETSLIQQYADQQWTLHQISSQQISLLNLLNAATDRLIKEGADIDAILATTALFNKQLHTIGIYEQRRRRASKEVLAQFKELSEARETALAQAAAIAKSHKTQGKPFTPAEFGFVCSNAEIDAYLRKRELLALAGIKTD